MSMISEQVRQIREWANGYKADEAHWLGTKKILLGAADTIEDLAEKLRAANMERSLACSHSGWIPFDELPPKESGKYCVCVKGGFVEQDYYDKEFDKWLWYANSSVEAWRRLPEPYQKSED